jgi:hypothetical protein
MVKQRVTKNKKQPQRRGHRDRIIQHCTHCGRVAFHFGCVYIRFCQSWCKFTQGWEAAQARRID